MMSQYIAWNITKIKLFFSMCINTTLIQFQLGIGRADVLTSLAFFDEGVESLPRRKNTGCGGKIGITNDVWRQSEILEIGGGSICSMRNTLTSS